MTSPRPPLPPPNAISVGLDPGLASGALAAVHWVTHRPELLDWSDFRPRGVAGPYRLGHFREWLERFREKLTYDHPLTPMVFAVEDQTWARIPGKLRGRTNAAAAQPLQAQSVAIAWAASWASDIVVVQPQSVRKAALGESSNFRPPRGVDPRLIEKLRRQHDRRVCEATERAVRQRVKGVPDGLSVHAIDAICCCLAARTKGRRG